MYYINKTDIFKVNFLSRYTEQKFQGKNKPSKTVTYFKYIIERQLGTERSRLSGVHILKDDTSKVIFENLEDAKNAIIKKLEEITNKVKNYK